MPADFTQTRHDSHAFRNVTFSSDRPTHAYGYQQGRCHGHGHVQIRGEASNGTTTLSASPSPKQIHAASHLFRDGCWEQSGRHGDVLRWRQRQRRQLLRERYRLVQWRRAESGNLQYELSGQRRACRHGSVFGRLKLCALNIACFYANGERGGHGRNRRRSAHHYLWSVSNFHGQRVHQPGFVADADRHADYQRWHRVVQLRRAHIDWLFAEARQRRGKYADLHVCNEHQQRFRVARSQQHAPDRAFMGFTR